MFIFIVLFEKFSTTRRVGTTPEMGLSESGTGKSKAKGLEEETSKLGCLNNTSSNPPRNAAKIVRTTIHRVLWEF